MTDGDPEKGEQILQEVLNLKSEVKAFRAEWKSEVESNFFHYMVALTIAVWTLGVAFLLSGKFPLEGLVLVFLGFVPMYAGILLRSRKRGGISGQGAAMPPPPPQVPPPGTGGQQPGLNVGEAQVLATMISGQDHTTWLAFTLGMTSEVFLINGFFVDTPLSRFLWVFPLSGILVAGVFWNIVLRSNADMVALYERAELLFGHIFHIPRHQRRGVSAGLVMNAAFGGWVIAWLTALAFFLNRPI